MLKKVGNRSDLVENGSEMGWTSQETDSGRRAIHWGWTGNILGNILLARLGGGLGGSTRLKYGVRALQSSSSSGRVGCAWATVANFQAACVGYRWLRWSWFCTSEFIWMKPTLWNDQNVFLTTLKIQVYPKTLLFSDEWGSDTNCWWEKPLLVALKHSEGIKHTVLFQQQEAYNN